MTQEPPRRTRPRPTFRNLEVASVQRLTPGLTRVTLSGPEIAGYESRGPGEHIRMWFPQEGYERPVMPEWTDEGPVMQEGIERPINRVYTPLHFNAEAGTLDVDIVLHPGSGGPGSQWAEAAKPGNQVVIAGPGGPYRVDSEAGDFVLASDHAGLPGLTTVLEALPATAKARCYIEVEDAAEAVPLSSPAAFEVVWLYSGHDVKPGAKLIDAFEREGTLPDAARVFVACEAGAMREIRRLLLYKHGLAREHIHTHGYWKAGESNHPDHDLGEEV